MRSVEGTDLVPLWPHLHRQTIRIKLASLTVEDGAHLEAHNHTALLLEAFREVARYQHTSLSVTVTATTIQAEAIVSHR